MNLLLNAKTCFLNTLHFSGRASKPEFWRFFWFVMLGLIVSTVINTIINGPTTTYQYALGPDGQPEGNPIGYQTLYHGGAIGNIFGLVCAVPFIAVAWRRMHDIGKPGYFPYLTVLAWICAILIVIVSHSGIEQFFSALETSGHVQVSVSPFPAVALLVAFILVLVVNIRWLASPSQPGTNKYGTNPYEVLR